MKHVEWQNTPYGDEKHKQIKKPAGDILQQQDQKMRGRPQKTFQADAFLITCINKLSSDTAKYATVSKPINSFVCAQHSSAETRELHRKQ